MVLPTRPGMWLLQAILAAHLCGAAGYTVAAAVGRRAACGLAVAALVTPGRAFAEIVERDMSKSASRESVLGYKDDVGVKSYTQYSAHGRRAKARHRAKS